MTSQLDRIEALLLKVLQKLRTPERERRAFQAGYHCRWHRDQGFYCFDPAMSPGDPEGAYAAWLKTEDGKP
jgi:hypothetical protein